MVDGQVSTAAFDTRREVINLEHSLHVFVEPSVQAWASSKAWIIHSADWMYVNSHFVDHDRRARLPLPAPQRRFYFVRNMFMIAMGVALIGYVALPDRAAAAACPSGASPTRSPRSPASASRTTPVSALLNPYAAVPSMHVCFALMVGWPLARLVKPRPLKVALVRSTRSLVTFVVVATGNHYWSSTPSSAR